MIRLTKTKSLGAVLLFSLVLQQSCTDNVPTRVLESGTDGGADGSETGGRPQGGSVATGGTATGTGGSNAGGAGGERPDPCLEQCADPDACTPEEQPVVVFCQNYAKHCLDQPADVMMERGPGTPIAAGPAATSTATRPQLSEADADALYSIEEAFRGGGVYTVTYSGGGEAGAGNGAGGEGGAPGGPLGERTVSYESGAWDPTGPIEDVAKIVPGYVVDPNGNPEEDGTFKTIQSAISGAVNIAGCPRIFIKVMPGTYREKITVPAKTSAPPITLYGVDGDPSRVVIVQGHSAAGDEAACTPLTVHASATFTNSLPQPFQARNLTIANDYVAGTCNPKTGDQTAVALLTQADKALFDNVRILGHRNALYVKSTGANEVSRAYFRDSAIEGDEDMILGRGAAVFDQCRIHSRGDRVSTSAITAPSTRVDNPHGILIINSQLSADAIVSDVYLGHTWYEGDTEEAVGKTIVRNSILGPHIRTGDAWAPTTRATPKTPTATSMVLYTSDDYYAPTTGIVPTEVFLAEFGNSGPGAAE